MKKIFLILILVLLNTINTFSNEAVRGFDDGIYYKKGNAVEYSYLNNSAILQIQSDNENVYYAKMFDDNNPDNLLGYCWKIEGPDNANAQITLTLNKSLLKGNQLPNDFCSRIRWFMMISL